MNTTPNNARLRQVRRRHLLLVVLLVAGMTIWGTLPARSASIPGLTVLDVVGGYVGGTNGADGTSWSSPKTNYAYRLGGTAVGKNNRNTPNGAGDTTGTLDPNLNTVNYFRMTARNTLTISGTFATPLNSGAFYIYGGQFLSVGLINRPLVEAAKLTYNHDMRTSSVGATGNAYLVFYRESIGNPVLVAMEDHNGGRASATDSRDLGAIGTGVITFSIQFESGVDKNNNPIATGGRMRYSLNNGAYGPWDNNSHDFVGQDTTLQLNAYTSLGYAFTASIGTVSTNSAPVAANDTYTVNEDATLTVVAPGVLANDSDPEGGALTAVLGSGPSNGTLTLNLDGSFTYTPTLNFNGSDSFTYRAEDAQGDTSIATVTITVTPVNDAPSFTKGADQTVLEDSGAKTVSGWATSISPGPANEAGQVLNFVVQNNNTALFSGQPAIASNGTLTYTPAPNAFGSASVTVALHDNGGVANGGVDTSPAQTFTITVTGVNDAPSFTKGADQTVLEDSGAQAVNAWATGISTGPAEGGQTLAFTVTGNTNPGLFSAGPVIASNGTLTYTPAPNAFGTATITIVLQDNGGAANGGVDTSPSQTFTILVTGINDAPSFTKGADQTVLEDAGAQVGTPSPWATGVSAGPGEGGQTLAFTVIANTNPGLFSARPAVSSVGTLTFTPTPNAFGTATITIVLQDNGGTANGGVDTSPAQTFVITVNSVNDVPSANNDSYTTAEDTPRSVAPGVLANDSDPDGGGLTAMLGSGPSNGTLTLNLDGSFTYTPTLNFNGSDSFTYRAEDAQGDTSIATVTITVTPVNDAPSFTKGADQTVLEDSGVQTISPWATGVSAGPGEGGQTLAFTVIANTNPGLFSARPAVSSVGTLTFTPTPNAFGTATITIVLQDNGGTANGGVDTSPAQTFVITVNSVNDVPSANNDSYTTAEDTPRSVAPGVLANDSDPDGGGLTAMLGSGPSNGTLTLNLDGSFTYTPTLNFNGSDSFTYRAEDAQGDTSTATVTITVTPVNDAPSFTKGANQTVNEDAGAQTVSGWATSISPGPANEAGQVLNFVVQNNNTALFSGQPAIASNGTLTYTPAPNAFGSASVTVALHDNGGVANGGVDTSPAQAFLITVNSANDPPTANNDSAWASRNSSANPINVLSNDSGAPDTGETLKITAVTPGTNGSVAITGGGSGLTYTPMAGFGGTDSFTYTISDGNGGTATATVSVTIGDFKVYMPIITRGPPATAPDLVGSFSLSPPNPSGGQAVLITATITNQGSAPAGQFWVDFYINPSTPPTDTNQPWNKSCGATQCPYGIAWYVSSTLLPGQSVTLTSTPGSYYAPNTRWPGMFASGKSDLYLYVDSWNPGVATGAVVESNESNNRTERHGQFTGSASIAPDDLWEPDDLPPRPVRPGE